MVVEMYSFEGDFRQKPQQNLGGASQKVPREILLQRAATERHQREEKRRQILAATKIQAYTRGYLVRCHQKSLYRQAFDSLLQTCGQGGLDNPDVLQDLFQKLNFFYSQEKDVQRLICLSQAFIRQISTITRLFERNKNEWLCKLQQLLNLNLRLLESVLISDGPLAVPLRVFEVFTASQTYDFFEKDQSVEVLQKLWMSVLNKGYFSKLCKVLNQRIPDSLIQSSKPPTPLAGSLLELFLRPLLVPGTKLYRSRATHLLLKEVFTGPFTAQVSLFLLPALNECISSVIMETVPYALLVDESGQLQTTLTLPPTPWLLYTVLTFIAPKLAVSESSAVQYLQLLYHLVPSISHSQRKYRCGFDDSESDDEIDMDIDSASDHYSASEDLAIIIDESLQLLNEAHHVKVLLSVLEQDLLEHNLTYFCCICHTLLCHKRLAVNKFRVLYTLAFKPGFLRLLWQSVCSQSTSPLFGSPTPLLQRVAQGILLTSYEEQKFLPQITLFCALLNYLLPTLHEVEFYGEETNGSNSMPFSIEELASISLSLRDICLGLIDLAYPTSRFALNESYESALRSVGAARVAQTVSSDQVKNWSYLFRIAVSLLRQLYTRDSRRPYCPEGHWIARPLSISVEKAADLQLGKKQLHGYELFQGLNHMTREQLEEKGPPLPTTEVRHLATLQELPFVMHFHERVKIFQCTILKDKLFNQGEYADFQIGQQIQVLIRRNYIYEDAFDKLSPENEPNLKLRMRVQLINAVGLDEAGIDGGGIFREFLNELLKTAFDPNRGFFKTTHDRQLFPNPGVHMVYEDFPRHYYFIGRLLGKAIYENMLVELPLAGFFLAKLLARHSTTDVDIHHLASLDPVMYKNLLYLKTYQGDVSDLGLDFTVMCSELGENHVVELKPGGSSVPVTESNRINYIHLMADYKLNKQIRAQCKAFKEGLASVIDLSWIHMFDPNELQILISGAQTPVDLEDLKQHTNYAGGYCYDHPIIQSFWKVVESFSEKQRRQLLKFVTSCSRPPLLGFKELSPAFCIQNAGEADRLPTASTCMNLLKLPEFKSEEVLRSKLLYAVESGAGFELS